MNLTLEKSSKPLFVRKNPYLKSYEQRHETGDIKFIIESEEIHAHHCEELKNKNYGETTDANFVCTESNERVPAHKSLFSLASEDFESMFYKAEFREFLRIKRRSVNF